MFIRPYKKKILVLRHRRTLKIPPDETFLSWEGKKIAAARQFLMLINIIFYPLTAIRDNSRAVKRGPPLSFSHLSRIGYCLQSGHFIYRQGLL